MSKYSKFDTIATIHSEGNKVGTFFYCAATQKSDGLIGRLFNIMFGESINPLVQATEAEEAVIRSMGKASTAEILEELKRKEWG